MKCVTRTEIGKNEKSLVFINKQFTVSYNECQVKFEIKNAKNLNVDSCNASCMNNFNQCFEVQKNQDEEVIENGVEDSDEESYHFTTVSE